METKASEKDPRMCLLRATLGVIFALWISQQIINATCNIESFQMGQDWILIDDNYSRHYLEPSESHVSLGYEECLGFSYGKSVNRFTKSFVLENKTSEPQDLVVSINHPWLISSCFVVDGEVYNAGGSNNKGIHVDQINPAFSLLLEPDSFSEVLIGGFGYGRVSSEILIKPADAHIRDASITISVYTALAAIGFFCVVLYGLLSTFLHIQYLKWYSLFALATLVSSGLFSGAFRVLTGWDIDPVLLIATSTLVSLTQLLFTHYFLSGWSTKNIYKNISAALIGLGSILAVFFLYSPSQILLVLLLTTKIVISAWCILLCLFAFKDKQEGAIYLAVAWVFKTITYYWILSWQLELSNDLSSTYLSLKMGWLIEMVVVSIAAFKLYRQEVGAVYEQDRTLDKENLEHNINDIYLSTMNGIRVHQAGLNHLIMLMKVCDSVPPKQEEKLNKIETYSNSLSAVLDTMNLLVKDDLRYQTNITKRYFSELYENTRQQFELKGLSLEFIISENVPVSLTFEKNILNRILMNLIDNGAKYTEEGGVTVEVDWQPGETEQGSLILTIRDTGIGIEQDHLKELGSLFYQGANQGQGTGSGVGLNTTRKLIKRIGGDFYADSKVGKGTTITLYLPAYLTDAHSISPSEIEEVSSLFKRFINLDLTGSSILIVSDKPLYAQVLMELFKQVNANVTCMNSIKDFYDDLRVQKEHDFIYCATTDVQLARDVINTYKHFSSQSTTNSTIAIQTAYCGSLDISSAGERTIMVEDPIESPAFIKALEEKCYGHAF